MTGRDVRGIAAIAVCTADRTSALRRCLTSCLTHLAAHDRQTTIVVFDASRDLRHRKANCRTTRTLTQPHRPPVHYVGAAEARQVRRMAVRNGFDPLVIRWLLPGGAGPQSAGAARNLMLLATAGSAILALDDDTVCTPWQHADLQSGVAFVGHVDPRDTLAFPDRQGALRAVTPSDVDLLERHEALLGRGIGELADAFSGDCDLSQACVHLLPGIDGRRPAWKVRATWAGVAGDSAAHCPYPLLFAGGATRDRLASSAETFRTALCSREVIRGVRRPSVTDESWFMSYCAGIDNTGLLPPFTPEGRNEDGLFGVMLRVVDPAAFIGHIPTGIIHDSYRDAPYDPRDVASASSIRQTDVVQWLTGSAGDLQGASTVAVRMRRLGTHLVSVGQMAPADFRQHVSVLATRAKWRLLQACELCLAGAFEYPSYWRAAFAQFQRAVLESLASPRMCVPLEYQVVAEVGEAMELLRRHVDRLGRALLIWPDLWDACRRQPFMPIGK